MKERGSRTSMSDDMGVEAAKYDGGRSIHSPMADKQVSSNPGSASGVYMDAINAMSREEIVDQLPVLQDTLEAIELDLERLMALRDTAIIRIAAMTARLAALQEEPKP